LFPSPGVVTIPFLLSGRQQQLGIDMNAGTFWFDPSERPEPLNELPALAAKMTTMLPPKQAPHPTPTLRKALTAIFWMLISLMFAVAGIWMMFAGQNTKDRVMGALCAVFFGLGMLPPIMDFRRLNKPPQRPSEDR
jgi:hypothetical protein